MKKLILFLVVVLALGGARYCFRDMLFPGAKGGELRIVMNTEATDISPYGLNLNNATRIRNMYEGLVAFDRNLKIVPALAVSWGNISETSWEFRLREGVLFHDGTPFVAQDVVDAYENAKTSVNSQIITYVSAIKEISVTDQNRILVTTYSPDPLLLSKLTKLFIHKEDYLGTGPYMLDEWVQGEHFKLNAFEGYWGQKPQFEKVKYEVLKSQAKREEAFSAGKIDLLIGITEEQALELPKNQVITSYGLEVNFLMFQLDDPLFEDRNIREAVLTLIDPEQIESIGNQFIRRVSQFIAPGVFGYNQDIPAFSYDPDNEAHDLFGKRLERVNFDYLSTFRTLSEYLSEQLRKAGFSVKESAVEPGELLKKIGRNESQLFLIGWRAEDGDAGGFFDSFIHSQAPFNSGRYINPAVDQLIEESRTEMNPQKRLALLQEIGAEVAEDLIGIPLFETSRLFAIGEGVKWVPRLDGQVLAAEVSK